MWYADEDRVDRYDDVFCRDRVPSYLRRYRIMPSPPSSIQHSHASAKQMAIDGDTFIFVFHNKKNIGDFHTNLTACISLSHISIHGPRHISNHFVILLAFLSRKKNSQIEGGKRMCWLVRKPWKSPFSLVDCNSATANPIGLEILESQWDPIIPQCILEVFLGKEKQIPNNQLNHNITTPSETYL